jgi:hypothetical protein
MLGTGCSKHTPSQAHNSEAQTSSSGLTRMPMDCRKPRGSLASAARCSSLKAVELANLAAPTLGEVIDQAHKGIKRIRATPHLAYSFLRHAGLSVS